MDLNEEMKKNDPPHFGLLQCDLPGVGRAGLVRPFDPLGLFGLAGPAFDSISASAGPLGRATRPAETRDRH